MENVATYILLTAARNEEDYIRGTIESVINQSIKPLKWIIVDDGSTDGTAKIAQEYLSNHPFIELVSVSGDSNRNFGSKAKAINFAFKKASPLNFEFVGNLDSDITFDSTYFESIIQEMSLDPNLGLAGGMRFDFQDGEFIFISNTEDSVGGPYQFFRRKCFEQIGGYQVLPYGGIDTVAEVGVRMIGWQVRSFPNYKLYHHRATEAQVKLLFKQHF